MRSITSYLLALAFVGFTFLIFPKSALGVCANWCTPSECTDWSCIYGSCCTWETTCCDNVCSGYSPPATCKQECDAGYYACNRTGGCCPIGSATPDPPPIDPNPDDKPPAGCTATKPTNMKVERTSATSVTF